MKEIDWEKEGYVCEQHPDEVFMHKIDGVECIGPGMKDGKKICRGCGLPWIKDTSFCEGELQGNPSCQ